MKKILVLLFAIVLLGLTGCTLNVALSTMMTSVEQNKIEWIDTNAESRAAVSLDSVTFEIYRVPKRNNKYIFEERDYLGAKQLSRGESFSVPSAKDYNYEFVTQVRCIEFNYSFVFTGEKDEINFFDYEGDIVMEVVKYCWGPLEHDEKKDGWTITKGIVCYRGEQEGFDIKYIFLNENKEAMARFYNEHKYGGRIIWNN